MTDLAKSSGLTRQAISQFENGRSQPKAETLFELARVLQIPESHFSRPFSDFEKQKESPPSFRSMASASSKARGQTETYLEFAAMLYSELTGLVELAEARIPEFEIGDFDDLSAEAIERIAESTRRSLNIGDGPISDLTLLLENHGLVVATLKLESKMEGVSQWYNGIPFTVVDPSSYCCRMRFSLAHELGHLVLHRNLLTEFDLQDRETFKRIEQQANHFASCFLLPEASFSAEVYRIDWDSLVRLKQRWMVSIAAMVMRLHSLELISDQRKTRMFQLISMKKARRIEPLDRQIPIERPRLMTKVATLLEENGVLPLQDWPRRFGLSIDLLSALTGIGRSKFLAAPDASASLDNVIQLKR